MEIRILAKEDFPFGLHEIPQPPKRLWVRGTMPPEGTKLLAVVGSRALTRYGCEACEYLISGLAGYPISIVSGLALGADACAHRAALDAGLHTIAIPGSGLGDDILYPRQNYALAQKILEAGGALLSEHPPNYASHPYDFPSRNRIMVGISQAVLMIEAGEKSGTLITARLTGDYNRDLLCVPHRIRDPHSAGGHQFLRLGAMLVSEPAHVLEALGFRVQESELEAVQRALPLLSDSEKILYELLDEARSRDELIRLSSLAAHEALAALSSLELQGFISERFGLWKRI